MFSISIPHFGTKCSFLRASLRPEHHYTCVTAKGIGVCGLNFLAVYADKIPVWCAPVEARCWSDTTTRHGNVWLFPLYGIALCEVRRPEVACMYTAPPPTALVINDDASQLHLMAALLEKDGLRVISCQSAEAALSVLDARGTVDVIVTDLHMPGIDGWRLCRLLRSPQYTALNTVPVLVVSATFSGTDAEQVTADLGANAFLPVPYDAGILRQNIRHLLAGRTPPASMRVVIVEPSPLQSATLRCTFEAHGYTVTSAATGVAGRDLLHAQVPEIAILDYYLPDMTGDQLLREFAYPGSSMVALVMSTDPSPELALHCMRLGADGFVHRPFEPEYLLDLCAKGRRSRALLRVENLLEERTQKLRESEAKFRLLFDNIPDMVLVHDAQGRLLYVNDVSAQQLAWPTAELIGRHLSDIVAPHCVASTIPQAHSGHTSRTGPSTMVYVTRTGQALEAEVNTCPIEFEGHAAVLAVAITLVLIPIAPAGVPLVCSSLFPRA